MSASRQLGRAGARRGSVLLFVLVLVVVVSAAILKFGERAVGEMAGEGYYVQRARLRGEAYSALEATLAVLALYREVDGGLYAPAQGWGDPLAESGYTPAAGRVVTVEFSDENAKLPLANAELYESAYTELFTGLGFEAGEVDVLTDSLLDWIDADDSVRPFGAEKAEYLQVDPPHLAANATPGSFAELAAVQGFADLMFTESGQPTARFEAFTRSVSLWNDGAINLNTVPDTALRASGLLDDQQLKLLGRALDTTEGDRGTTGANYYTSLSDLEDKVGDIPSIGLFGVVTKELAIVVTVRERQTAYRLRAVIRTDTTGTTSSGSAGSASTAGASSSSSGTSGSFEYPFRFLELVEDPPPSTISNPTQSL